MHPLDDGAPPRTKAFERAARKMSRKVSRGVRNAGDQLADSHAIVALNFYRDEAMKNNEPHYSVRYDKALGRSTGDG
jgi:hypothetical protein